MTFQRPTTKSVLGKNVYSEEDLGPVGIFAGETRRLVEYKQFFIHNSLTITTPLFIPEILLEHPGLANAVSFPLSLVGSVQVEIVYDDRVSFSITGVVDAGGGDVEATTGEAHPFQVGDTVTVSGTSSYNGTKVITAVGSTTELSWADAFAGSETGIATGPNHIPLFFGRNVGLLDFQRLGIFGPDPTGDALSGQLFDIEGDTSGLLNVAFLGERLGFLNWRDLGRTMGITVSHILGLIEIFRQGWALSPNPFLPFISIDSQIVNQNNPAVACPTAALTISAPGGTLDVALASWNTNFDNADSVDSLFSLPNNAAVGVYTISQFTFDGTVDFFRQEASLTISGIVDSPTTPSTQIRVTTTTPAPFNEDDSVIISGTVNYNGTHNVARRVSANTFDVIVAFVSNEATGVVIGNGLDELSPGVSVVQCGAQPDSTPAIHVNVASEISDIDEKLVPVGADLLVIEDSADANSKKRVQLDNLPGSAQLFRFNTNMIPFPPAGAASRNGHPILEFDDSSAEDEIFNESMSRDYRGASITVDIDWVAETAVTGGVAWGVEFERIAPGGQDIDSDGFAAQQTGTSTTNATNGVVTRTSITLTQAQADAIEAGDAFRLRIERVTGDGGDTMVNDAQVLRIVGRQ